MDPLFLAAIVSMAFVMMLGAEVLSEATVNRRSQLRARSDAPNTFLREQATGQVDLGAFSRGDIVAQLPVNDSDPASVGKRVFDIVAAFSLIFFLAPVLVATAIAIRLDSKGSILYRQKRVGLNGRGFEIYKFRSMVADAEKDGVRWAAKNDCRVTRIGRFIRKTRIDEIPQAINVLKGEMSFVGPRPERPEFVELLESEIPNYQLRHMVKPGITGWAQVKYVYGASVEDAREKLKFDLYYIKHYSLMRDIFIVLMTVRVALCGIGSR